MNISVRPTEGKLGQDRITASEKRFLDIHGQRTRGEDRLSTLLPPPYQVSDVEMLFVGVRFEGGTAAKLLPPGLEAATDELGLICTYTAGSGWGVAPFSSCFIAVQVKGFNAPDGSAAYCIVGGWYSGKGFEFMNTYFNTLPERGFGELRREAGNVVGVGGKDGNTMVRCVAVPTPQGAPEASAVHHYLGRHPGGAASLFAIAFNGNAVPAEPKSITIDDAAGERMLLARPKELTWALHCHDVSLTFGIPSVVGADLDLSAPAAQVSMFEAFARIGHAALIVTRDLRIEAVSEQAKGLLGDGLTIRDDRLVGTTRKDQGALEDLAHRVFAAEAQTSAVEHIAIGRRLAAPLIVQAMGLGKIATGRPSALLLLNDPARQTTASAMSVLQLLGLTPSEARIAHLVGAGKSPRAVADDLGLSLNTVRSALKIVFDKLRISRQAELAKIVARLAG